MTPLLVLYTANIRGDLDLLPRLYTFIRHVKAQPFEDESEVMLCPVQPIPVKTVLLDLGNSCVPGAWHCAATGGRSTLMVLDAMGYQAVNIAGVLTDEARERLKTNVMTAALIDNTTVWHNGDVLVTTGKGDSSNHPHKIHIVCTPADPTRLEGRTLFLAGVFAGQVGIARLDIAGGVKLLSHEIVMLPPTTLPDATIAATVDFVADEARYFQRRRDHQAGL